MSNDAHRFMWHTRIAQAVSAGILLFGLVAVTVYIEPALVGVPEDQASFYKGSLLWLLAGSLFIALGLAFFVCLASSVKPGDIGVQQHEADRDVVDARDRVGFRLDDFPRVTS